MDETLLRLRQVFEYSNKNKTELAKMLEVTPQYIWKLVNKDDAVPSPRMILATVKSFPEISEEWLRTGFGKMLKEKTRESEIAEITLELAKNDDYMAIEMSKLLLKMTPEQIKALYNFMLTVIEKDHQ